jgi:hypothetical protein
MYSILEPHRLYDRTSTRDSVMRTARTAAGVPGPPCTR